MDQVRNSSSPNDCVQWRLSRLAFGCAVAPGLYPFGPAVDLLILIGARREEVAAMQWGEVDLAAKTWTLPGERSKNGVAHVVPLSDSAISILEKVPRIGRRDGFILTTTGETAISGWSKRASHAQGRRHPSREVTVCEREWRDNYYELFRTREQNNTGTRGKPRRA